MARLFGLPTAKVARWVKGYQRHSTLYPAVMEPELRNDEGVMALSFRDLIELHFIRAFLEHGVSLPAIRQAAKIAAEIIGVESHPFITHRFMTDRKSILHDVDKELLNLNHEQYELKGIISQSLYRGIVFEGNDPVRWHPDSESKTVVLDPRYALGKPSIEHSGIRTRTIFYAWKAEEKDEKRVAALYGLKLQQVRDAVRFEQKMAA